MDDYLRRLKRKYDAGEPDAAQAYIAALERIIDQSDDGYEIQRTLVVSTSHISQEDATYLEQASTWPLSVVWLNYEYGWIIYLFKKDDYFQEVTQGAPQSIVSLMRLAIQLNCDWLRIDADGPEVPGLPTYEW